MARDAIIGARAPTDVTGSALLREPEHRRRGRGVEADAGWSLDRGAEPGLWPPWRLPRDARGASIRAP